VGIATHTGAYTPAVALDMSFRRQVWRRFWNGPIIVIEVGVSSI
jgi:hypothetical protein